MDVVSPKGPSSAEAVGRHGLKAGCQGEQSRSKAHSQVLGSHLQ